MNIAHYISNWWKEALEYKERVLKDGGTTKREDIIQQYNQMSKQNGIFDSIKFAWLGEAGGKLRTSGANKFWTKAYSLVTTNDATQTTSTSQPYIAGNIAPTEKLGMKNPNGASNYMTHPTISFAANEAWSVTTVLNNNYATYQVTTINSRYVGSDNSSLRLMSYGSDIFSFQNELGTVYTTGVHSYPFLSKNTIITWVADGKNNLYLYINGINVYTFSSSISSYVSFNNFLSYDTNRPFNGSIHAHIIRAQALTPTQVEAEANFLRSLYPEIPSVTIGSQVWATSNCDMVATPQGNLFQNFTLNSNVEKITNAADREFSSDTGFWSKAGETTISGGVCNIKSTTGSYSAIVRANILTAGKWIRVKYDIKRNASGTLSIQNATSPFEIDSAVGDNKILYFLNASVQFEFKRTAICDIDIDNISVQEVGWSDSTNLYDYVYANTAGTVEKKTYAAVKAAAMWCYYNNDAALGAVYGKLLNDYAIKLLDMDIAYYNTANPTKPWGWGIPTEADWNALETTVNNDAEALKHAGTTYWTAPNAGTNSSGFTALPAGYRKEDGTFGGLGTTALFGSTDMSVPIVGKSLRLIKR